MRISDWSSDVCSSDLHRDGHGVPGLFTPAGRYGYEGFWCEGIDEIEDLYERRRRPGTRKSRHVFTNVWVRFEGHDKAVSQSIFSLYAIDGDPEASTHPISILDYPEQPLTQPAGSCRFLARLVPPPYG